MDESHQDSNMHCATCMPEEESQILRNDNLQSVPTPERRPNANNVNASDVLRFASASSGNGVFIRLNSSEGATKSPTHIV